MEVEPDYLLPEPRAELSETEVLDDWRPEGLLHRLALMEAADLSWFVGEGRARSDLFMLHAITPLLAQSRSVSGLPPIFCEIDLKRSDRARTSAENRFPAFPLVMTYLPGFMLSGKSGRVQSDELSASSAGSSSAS